VSAGDQRRFGTAWRQGVFYMLIAAVPLLCLLAVFAGPTADILANGGLRDGNLIAQLAACLAVVAVAQLVGGLHDYGQRPCSPGSTTGARIASFAGWAPGAGQRGLDGAAGAGRAAPGLAVAILAGELAGGLTALIRLRRAMRPEAMLDRRTRSRSAGHRRDAAGDRAGLVAARRAGAGPGLELALLVVCGLVALVPYALVLLLLGSAYRPLAAPPATAQLVPAQRDAALPAGRWASGTTDAAARRPRPPARRCPDRRAGPAADPAPRPVVTELHTSSV